MSTPLNQAAYLDKAGQPLEVRQAPLPSPGTGEIVVRNSAIAINPLDWHMADHGVFIRQWPAIFGCDVAGIVYAVGEGVTRFKVGDRVIGHTINLVTGRPEHGAFAHYSIVPEIKAAILPSHITFQDGCVIPFALEAAVCVLSVKEAGFALPEVPIPALGLGYPSSEKNVKELGKTLVIHGGSSSVGSMTTQIARATGINVVSIVGPANMDLAKRSGANIAIDRHTPDLVEKVLAAVHDIGKEFIGIFDAIGDEGTLKIDLEILDHLQGGHLALTHPPPPGLPENVKAGMIFAVNDIATPVWQDFVTPALENGRLQCLPPPLVVGNDLGAIQKTLEMSKAGVSGRKLVVLLD